MEQSSGSTFAPGRSMSPTHKSSHTREDEEERSGADAPRVDELEPDERTVGNKLDEEGEDDERDLEDEYSEEIDLDAIPAMEGPDA
jgi:hypothetical protein